MRIVLQNLSVTGFVQVWELFYKISRLQALFRYENCSKNLPVTGFVQVWELFYKTSRLQALFRYENCSTKPPGHRLCSGMTVRELFYKISRLQALFRYENCSKNLPVTGFVQVWELSSGIVILFCCRDKKLYCWESFRIYTRACD